MYLSINKLIVLHVNVFSIVSEHAEIITHLQWHPSGRYLLSADRSGVFKLWSMKVC